MIIDYDHNPNLNTDQKLQSLMMSIQMALNSGEIFTGNKAALDFYHPVGSYFETSDISFNPNKAWGGTWVLEEEGLVHIGAGENYAVGDTGGEDEVTLTTSEIPAHTHGNKSLKAGFSGRRSGANEAVSHWAQQNATVTQSSSSGTTTTASGTANKHTDVVMFDLSHEHSSVGGGQAHNNMQPFVVVNRWHRTA